MFIPVIGSLISAASSLFKTIERAVNSSEHNFKADLISALEAVDWPVELRVKILEVLNQGHDQDIGGKLNAMLQNGFLPPEAAELIGQLAEKNGVPDSSIDKTRIGEGMNREECRATLGGVFSNELDQAERDDDALTTFENSPMFDID